VLRIGFISFNLSSLDKGCCRFERFRLAQNVRIYNSRYQGCTN